MLAKGIRQFLPFVVFITRLVLALATLKTTAGESQVFVLYAGSLGNLMETDVGPAFSRATGYKYLGEAKGFPAFGQPDQGEAANPGSLYQR